jgi:hypothetical protein
MAPIFVLLAPSSPAPYADVGLGVHLSYADVIALPAPTVTRVIAQIHKSPPKEIALVESLITDSALIYQEVIAPRRGARKRTGLAYQDSWYTNPSRMSSPSPPPTRRNICRD